MKNRGRVGARTLTLGGVLWSLTILGAASAATDPVEVTTLGNGLAVYTRAGDYSENYVSVRLVVDPPPALPGSREYREFQTLAHSVFRSDSSEQDLFKYLDERACYAAVYVEYREAVLEFDVFPEHLDTLFVRMARQWETGLSGSQVALGAHEARQALPGTWDPVIERLGRVAGDGVLYDLPPREYDIPYQFASRMCARHLSLVVVGSKANVDRARSAAKILERIPEGQQALMSPLDAPPGYRLTVPAITVTAASDADYATYGDLLREHLTWDTQCPWAIELLLTGAGGSGSAARGRDGNGSRGLNPAETHFYFGAFIHRLQDVVSLRYGSAYAFGGNLYLGPAEHVMTFWPNVDQEIVRYDELAEEIKGVAAELVEPASIGWWQAYVEGRANAQAFYGLGAPDASTAADGLVELVTLTRLQGREEFAGPYIPSADEAQEGFARMLASAEWFVVAPTVPDSESAVYASVASAFGYVYGDLFGPNERTRALAVMCVSLLVLLVLREAERRMGSGRA